MATLPHLRLTLPDDTLARLFGTSRSTIRRALTQTRQLLDQHGLVIQPATAPPDLPARIPPYARPPVGNPHNKIKAAC